MQWKQCLPSLRILLCRGLVLHEAWTNRAFTIFTDFELLFCYIKRDLCYEDKTRPLSSYQSFSNNRGPPKSLIHSKFKILKYSTEKIVIENFIIWKVEQGNNVWNLR